LTISRQSGLIPTYPQSPDPRADNPYLRKLLGWKLRVKFRNGPVRIANWRVPCGDACAKIEKLPLKLQSHTVNPEISVVQTNGLTTSFRRLSE
jgi:hypothetical protein